MTMPGSTLNTVHPWVAEGEQRVRFGVVDDPSTEWSETLDFALRAEAMGFDSIWANDHPMFLADCWTTLSALAVSTSTIRLMSLVNCVYYRSPVLTARMAADVDRLSGGRLVLGVGVGDHQAEFAQMALPYPPIAERQAALEEALQIIRGLWSGEPTTVSGDTFAVDGANMPIGPVQQPHIPILLAGGGERVTLRQVAQYADMSNFGAHAWAGGAFDAEDVRRKLGVLDAHLDALSRPRRAVLRSHYSPLVKLAGSRAEVERKAATARYSPIEKIAPFFGTPDDAIAHFGELIDAGMRYFLVVLQGDDRETMRLLSEEVMPALEHRGIAS